MRKQEFDNFYRTNVDKVYRFVFFRTGKDRELANDLVAEIFLKVLEHFESYDEQKSKTAWLMTICKNHLANYWRDNRKTVALGGPGVPDEERGSEDVFWLRSAIHALQKQAAKVEIYELLGKLDQSDAEIVTFHYLLGYNYREVADLKGMSEGAVKVAAHRAIKKLRTLL